MTEKQAWARKRNWLIRRLMGARSIFSQDNITFMRDTIKENAFYVHGCEEAIEDLLDAMRKSIYKET